MSDGGKGSSPRPYGVPLQDFSAKWEATFGKEGGRTGLVQAHGQGLCKRMAKACGADERDQWQLYADTFEEDAKTVLEAATKLREKNAS